MLELAITALSVSLLVAFGMALAVLVVENDEEEDK